MRIGRLSFAACRRCEGTLTSRFCGYAIASPTRQMCLKYGVGTGIYRLQCACWVMDTCVSCWFTIARSKRCARQNLKGAITTFGTRLRGARTARRAWRLIPNSSLLVPLKELVNKARRKVFQFILAACIRSTAPERPVYTKGFCTGEPSSSSNGRLRLLSC